MSIRYIAFAVLLAASVRAAFAQSPIPLEAGVDRPGSDMAEIALVDAAPQDCAALCAEHPECKAFTFVAAGIQGDSAVCWLKNAVPTPVVSDCCTSGVRDAGWVWGVDRPGSDYRDFDLDQEDPALCQQACLEDAACQAFTYVRPGLQGDAPRCWLKEAVPAPMTSDCCASGILDRRQ
ncbi:PAN domain-containing protein [Aquimonas voraii]|uniref:PAN domain-containing protein n=1 Tax=Aquimonas voraii TaxID=265719 RepID=A0A1G6XXE2_9GAMM|nr:PAN domain-containing protein [Aquimonas voraii]SDD82661.1 PAN domain-containing protein [Aquimonas voraii]